MKLGFLSQVRCLSFVEDYFDFELAKPDHHCLQSVFQYVLASNSQSSN